MEVADRILAALGKPESLKTIVPDRPGHDRRYVLDSSKLRTRAGLGALGRVGAGAGGHGGLVRGQPGLVGAAPGPGARRRGVLGTPEAAERCGSSSPGRTGSWAATCVDCLAGRVPDGRPSLRAARPGGSSGRGSTTRCWPPTSTPCASTTATPSCSTFSAFRPELVLHGGAFTAVERCETEVDAAYAVNAHRAPATSPRPPRWSGRTSSTCRPTTSSTAPPTAPTGSGTPRARPRSTAPPSWRASASAAPARPSCARAGSAVPTAPTWSVTALRLADGDGRAALRRRPARVADLHGRPGAGRRHPRARPPPRHLPRDQRRRHHLVGLRAGRPRRGGRRPRAGAAHRHGRARPAAAWRPARPTRCSTTWRCA